MPAPPENPPSSSHPQLNRDPGSSLVSHIARWILGFGYGVLVPVLCLWLDPVVFKGDQLGPPLLGDFRVLAYALFGAQTLCLIWWATGHRSARAASAFLAMNLTLGAIAAAGLGLVLMLPGAFALWLLGGFIPFGTFFVYLYACSDAWRVARQHHSSRSIVISILVSLAVFVALPCELVHFTDNVVGEAIIARQSEDEAAIETARTWLRICGPFARTTPLVMSYLSEDEADREEAIRWVYSELTGESIDAVAMYFRQY